ncbi:receptor-like protein Cf-9 homolog [Gossypium hirsutum]|uniref:Receptor-like protein Cf-9 homolog n=1 Tax=Gossypium hirsutum TaxID=3635 RepID=A0ABM3A0T2_GOSHI|nr:receptor-like protein Cf-9 homolog [Gossypium hirsutum]
MASSYLFLFLCLFLFFPQLYASFSSSGSHSCSSLIQFKNSFSTNQTNAAYLSCDDQSYPKTDSWKEGTDCCSWDGVTCDHLNAHVIALDLSCSSLYGNFPSNTTLFLLPHLQKLNLAYNDFNLSKIPSEFGQFTSLFYFNLSHTGFAGEVPSQVSHLSKLVSLDLSGIEEQLTIDKYALEGLVHNLTEVRHLFLDGINMSSVNAHVFMNLSSSLRSLSLAGCDLQGKFPKNIFDLPNLNLLNLRRNQLSGQIPRSLGNLLQLTHLDLSWNRLSGQIPRSLGNLLQLTHLDLSENQLRGQIPRSLGNLLQLTHLDLSWNRLSGQIPISLGSLLQLTHLDLSWNRLSGQIPRSLGNLLQLTQLDLSENQLSGQIPRSLGNHLQLTVLDLSGNQLSGQIPLSILNLTQLEYLRIAENALEGSIPDEFFTGLKSLESLDLSCNKIEGKIPQWMQEVGNVSLTYFNVSHNSLTEVEHFPWKNIESLDLSSNLISGNLPIPASTINVFFISNNSFNGEVSSLICNASSLRILDLSHNNLSGTIPQCFGNLSNSLQFLNLKKNKFYGTIPPTFAEGCQLTNFNLNGNLLEGPLTPSILNCNDLEVLDLGNNKINDTFPHWLGSLPYLQVLVLKSNLMHGSLRVNSSKSSPFFSKIQIFDLSNNYFSGPLPVRYINSFKAIINLEKIGSTVSYMGVNDDGGDFYTYSIGIVMKGQDRELVKIFTMWMIIDLSNNQFEGGIPEVFGKLNLLKGLNLSHNNLNGGIPTSVGNLKSLEWLDLSSNRLSGTIPNRLADLPFLSSFNVSGNQLHGHIPQGKQFNTFGNDSYQGNKGLCGFPVSKGCNIIEPPPPNVLEKDGSKSNITFGWKVVLIGYGCGVVFGMSVGYVVFQTGKPKWLVNLVEIQHEKKRRRKSKDGSRSNGRRRI